MGDVVHVTEEAIAIRLKIGELVIGELREFPKLRQWRWVHEIDDHALGIGFEDSKSAAIAKLLASENKRRAAAKETARG